MKNKRGKFRLKIGENYGGIYGRNRRTEQIGCKQDAAYLDETSWDYYTGKTAPFYSGPLPAPGSEDYAEKYAELERIYLSANLIGECVQRHTSALIGKPFHFTLKGKDGQEIDAGRVDKPYRLLQQWIEHQRQQVSSQDSDWGDPFRDAVIHALVDGRGYLRLWMPRRFRRSPDFYRRIALHSPLPGSVQVERDSDGMLERVSYTFEGGSQEQYWFDPDEEGDDLEATDGDGEFGVPSASSPAYHDLVIESSYNANADPSTPDTTQVDIYPQLNERWTVQEIRIDPVVCEDVKRVQNSCNLALTTLNINILLAGYRTKYFTGTLPPGDYVDDPERPNQKMFVPNGAPFVTGPNKNIFLAGIPYGDPRQPSLTTPGMTIEDPVNVDTFERTVQLYRTLMYVLFGQGFLLNAGDGSMSGVSRIHVKQDFVISLDRHVNIVEAAITGVLESVMRLLDVDGEFADLTPVAHLRPWIGSLLPEERDMIIATYKEGLMSRTTAMALLGDVDDTRAEWELMQTEPSAQFDKLMALHEKGVISDMTLLTRSGLFDEKTAADQLQAAAAERTERMEQALSMQQAALQPSPLDGDTGDVSTPENG